MFKQIKYFQAVVRCNSFSEAAAECYISQSAISQQIRALEKTLGVQLLQRHGRSFALTPAGQYFYNKSLVLLADFERLCLETSRLARKEQAQLRVAYLNSYIGPEFQLAVADFASRYSEVEIKISRGSHEQLYDDLRLERIDLALSDQRRAFSDAYTNLVLLTSEYHIELTARNPLAALPEVELADLKSLPCILVAAPSQQDNEQQYYRDIVGVPGDIVFADTLETARMLVLSGQGYMLIEGCADELLFSHALRRVRLLRQGKPIKRSYCAFWKKDNSGYYVETFAELLQAQFNK